MSSQTIPEWAAKEGYELCRHSEDAPDIARALVAAYERGRVDMAAVLKELKEGKNNG